MPDLILYWDRGVFGGVPYDDFLVEQGSTRFIEDGYVPSDAVVVGQTWRFVRRDGGPDRRFNNNRQLPIAQYGTLTLRSSRGRTFIFKSQGLVRLLRLRTVSENGPRRVELSHGERPLNRVPKSHQVRKRKRGKCSEWARGPPLTKLLLPIGSWHRCTTLIRLPD